MIKNKISKKNASISLTLVIATTGMLLISGITLLITGIDLSFATKSFTNSQIAETKAYTCFEESLYKLKYDTTYTGTVSFNYDGGVCNAILTNDQINSNYKNIALSATFNEFAFSENKIIDISQTPFLIIN